ncbi:universal stress protein [Quadrisphaera sp. DSM 44207]|uniref:universal stress protein n=1 Tax=Quadrisphaera sp. DSM 44207 TaxID=1881057 RepID=UPI0008855561|nr:universal stress protein [Quadrisphaera sp. DSM 44207]SDQ21166.1 Nucleotide-binding universal stress protein, UspA family [Quadrisphaera sp. DSM 44207]
MTLVVGYAPTPQGEAALAAAGEEAILRGRALVVVRAHRGESRVDPEYPPTSGLAYALASLRNSGLHCEVRELDRAEDVAEAIIAVADEVGAELVVIGLKRRSPVGKVLLGSTAQRVLLGARCPVLAVQEGHRRT